LSHPGRVRRQVVGVGDDRLLDLVAGALAARGSEHALVVHGDGSLDELALTGPTEVREVRDGEVVGAWTASPGDVGLATVAADDLPGGDAEENAAIARRVLAGEAGPARDIVLLNAGAGLHVAGLAASLGDGVALAAAAVDDGRAAEQLDRVRARTGAA
jgi:anthranilate phosphoribosyltransferase